jgi:hypothetical protein
VPALAKVPAVIRADRSAIDLLPPCPPDVAYPEVSDCGVGLKGHAEGVPEAPGERFDTEIEADKSQVPKEGRDLIKADPESTTYQFVPTAYPQQNANA